MRTASDYYQLVVSELRSEQAKDALVNVLKYQMFGLMRGVQIAEQARVRSMQVLITSGVALLQERQSDVLASRLQQVLNIIEQDHTELDAMQQAAVALSAQALIRLSHGETAEKSMSGRWPWECFDRDKIDGRPYFGFYKPQKDMPAAGLTPTMNNRGWEFPVLEEDVYSEAVKCAVAKGEKQHVLVLGAGYGAFACTLLEASRKTGAQVTVNDISLAQMLIFKDQLPRDFDGRATIVTGDALGSVEFPEETFDAVVMQNVIHFFTPEQTEALLERTKRWLKPGGSLTLTGSTPFWNVFSGEGNHIQVFKTQKAAGDPWPGFIASLKGFLEKLGHPMAAHCSASPLHNHDPDTLGGAMQRAGFTVVQSGFFKAPTTFPAWVRYEGSEYVGVTAVKPC